jgi:hypothetical protein
MPPTRAPRRAPARVIPRQRRPQGTGSQRVVFNPTPEPCQCLSPRRVISIAASQATEPPTFESQLRDADPEEATIALSEGSRAATEATVEADVAKNGGFDTRFADNFDGIDWAHLLRFTKLLATRYTGIALQG